MRRYSLLILITACLAFSCQPGSFVPDGPGPNPWGEFDFSGEEDNGDDNTGSDDGPAGTGSDIDVETHTADDDEDILDPSEFTKTISIVWNGNTATVKNDSKLTVTADGAHVTVGSPGAEGKKVRISLSGSTSDGSLKIYNGVKPEGEGEDTRSKILLSFDGVNLASSRGPAINIQSSKRVFAQLSDGTVNTLSDAATYSGIPEGEDAKACFFSEKKVCFSGTGSLSVQGNCKHAICVDDYIHILGGNLTAVSSASDGIHTNEYVKIDAGTVTVSSVGEGIQCEEAETGWFSLSGGTVDITTSGQKGHGIRTASDLLISGGTLSVKTAGIASKCLKSDNNVTITGGTVTLVTTGGGCFEDGDTSASACIKSENNTVIRGGTLNLSSSGAGGKGISAYNCTIADSTDLTITTTGNKYTYSTASSSPKGIKATNLIRIEGGRIAITTTGSGGEGMESGLKTTRADKDNIVITGGEMVILCTRDDCINSKKNGRISISGGCIYAWSQGNDALDCNYGTKGAISISGGVVIGHAAKSPEEAIDADGATNLVFSGGVIFSSGGKQMSSGQPECGESVFEIGGSLSAGYFVVTDDSGKVVMCCKVPRQMSQNYSYVASPDFRSGTTYKYGVVQTPPAGSKSVFGDYYYTGGTASVSSSVTASSGYTAVGVSSSGGGPGGPGRR